MSNRVVSFAEARAARAQDSWTESFNRRLREGERVPANQARLPESHRLRQSPAALVYGRPKRCVLCAGAVVFIVGFMLGMLGLVAALFFAVAH